MSIALAGLISLFNWAAVWMILRDLFRKRAVGAENVFGAICGYLIAGEAWAGVHGIVYIAMPAAYSINPAISGFLADWHGRHAVFSYYGFAQMLTLGYADVTPVRPPATTLSLLGALFGLLYRLVVSQFVGLAQSGKRSPDDHASADDRDPPCRDSARPRGGSRPFQDTSTAWPSISTFRSSKELATLPGKYSPPGGRLLLAGAGTSRSAASRCGRSRRDLRDEASLRSAGGSRRAARAPARRADLSRSGGRGLHTDLPRPLRAWRPRRSSISLSVSSRSSPTCSIPFRARSLLGWIFDPRVAHISSTKFQASSDQGPMVVSSPRLITCRLESRTFHWYGVSKEWEPDGEGSNAMRLGVWRSRRSERLFQGGSISLTEVAAGNRPRSGNHGAALSGDRERRRGPRRPSRDATRDDPGGLVAGPRSRRAVARRRRCLRPMTSTGTFRSGSVSAAAKDPGARRPRANRRLSPGAGESAKPRAAHSARSARTGSIRVARSAGSDDAARRRVPRSAGGARSRRRRCAATPKSSPARSRASASAAATPPAGPRPPAEPLPRDEGQDAVRASSPATGARRSPRPLDDGERGHGIDPGERERERRGAEDLEEDAPGSGARRARRRSPPPSAAPRRRRRRGPATRSSRRIAGTSSRGLAARAHREAEDVREPHRHVRRRLGVGHVDVRGALGIEARELDVADHADDLDGAPGLEVVDPQPRRRPGSRPGKWRRASVWLTSTTGTAIRPCPARSIVPAVDERARSSVGSIPARPRGSWRAAPSARSWSGPRPR